MVEISLNIHFFREAKLYKAFLDSFWLVLPDKSNNVKINTIEENRQSKVKSSKQILATEIQNR